ncbi:MULTISPECIES: DUF11 domain-containing protein [unclassified Stenotrophomonas]|uniref:DUF11 domain-containing protein n=1 Tax=unclassified Stenotrophomonas TaxID=196198 RepID=UPI00190D0BDE|nr:MULTISPECIES: DUF11 domain-containing protein [unclassified Stenotrophomonas]MBK0054011.1 DUF11 domain-containing protein [Stenotrophomonas sp. S39]MDI9272651.1 DUF11 domain-containing protein [Stenotrophomonas sp. PFBMAA-4]
MVNVKGVKASSLRWQALVMLVVLAVLSCLGRAQAQSACTAGACVSAGPRLVSVDSTQSPILNLLFSALLPGTSLTLSVADWNSLAGANVNLNALLTQLNGGVTVSDPSQVLNTNITLGQLRAAMVQVLQADGQTAAANVLNVLPLGVAGTSGSIRLADILQVALPTGSLATVRLNVLDLLTGGVQLYNFRNVLTTPTPITVNTAALGLNGVANVRLWAQVIEPPSYNCGTVGAAFHSAAIRIKLDMDLVQGLNTGTLTAALNGLNLLGVSLSNTSISADVLHLQVYADVARAEGSISAVNLVGNAVTLQARPGLVNLYVGQISDATFFNRSTVLTETALTTATLTNLSVKVRVGVTLLGATVPVADITIPIAVGIRGFATATPGLQSASFTGPYPQTRTLTAGTVSAATLVSTLVNSLNIQLISGNPQVTLLGSLSLPLPVADLVNGIVNTLLTPVRTLVNAVVTPVLTAVLGGVVDNLLALLGIRVGQAVFTVEGVTQACAATLQLVKDLQPTSDSGRFNLSITYNGSTVGSASNVGNNGATAAIITVPGGSYALAEAAAAGTTLTRYASTWQCTDQNNTVVSSGSGGSFTLQAPAMTATATTLVCRITNRTRQADLSITKSDGSGTYTPGGTATYTLQVVNNGPDAVTNATVTDTLPNGTTLRGAWTCSATSGSTCAAASGGAAGGNAVNVGVNLVNGGQATISVPVSFSNNPGAY